MNSSHLQIEPQRHNFVVHGVPIEVFDASGSQAAWIVACELKDDAYGIASIALAPDDVVVDIGGHIGLFAIYLGMRFPGILIHSFEPFPGNYELFRSNLALNPVSNVRLHPFAISRDGRDLEMVTDPRNSGAATCNSTTLRHQPSGSLPSMTLDQVFDSLKITTCKLLKIDCEGSEHDILLSTHVLPRVQHLSGEVHMNRFLASQGYSFAGLHRHCRQYIPAEKIVFRPCTMSE